MTSYATLLAVDDEPNNLRALKIDLEDAGYRVLTARDGKEAWDMLQSSLGIEAILLDRMMPHMDGMQFMEKLKIDDRLSSIPVIMQTAAAEKEQVVEGIRAGVYYYLTKPYDRDIMLSIVYAAVNDYANYSQLRKDLRKFTRKLALVKEARFEAQTLEDANYLATFLAQFFPIPEKAVFGISELIINAIEHGNLGIGYEEKSDLNQQGIWEKEVNRRLGLTENASKTVKIAYLRDDSKISLTIRDEGYGFDWRNYLEISPERAMHSHGRGIALSKTMSFDEMEYTGTGNEVVCIAYLDPKRL